MMVYLLIAAVAVAIIVTVGIRCDDCTDFVYRYPTPRKTLVQRIKGWFAHDN